MKATEQSVWICGQMITAESVISLSLCITSKSPARLDEVCTRYRTSRSSANHRTGRLSNHIKPLL